MEQVLHTRNKAPDETLLQIGNIDHDIDPEILASAVQDYITWFDGKFGTNARVLDAALHFDEKTGHGQIRQTYWYTDADGVKHIGQEKALEQLGYQLPDPEKKVDRHNNRKIPFTAECREKWYDIAESYGFHIDRVPRKPKKDHVDTKEYIRKQKKELSEREKAINEREQEVIRQKISISAREKALEEKEKDLEAKEKALEDRKSAQEEKDQYSRTVFKQVLQARKAALELLDGVRDQRAAERLKTASTGVTERVEAISRRLPNVTIQEGRNDQYSK